jgi:CubicO group peptidase (beta-lactamase class C family)
MSNVSVNIDNAVASIQRRLNGNVVGYALAIGTPTSGPVKYCYGEARTAADPPSVPVGSGTKFQSASTTKFVTALAVMRLLNGPSGSARTVDSPIGPFLPSNWMLGSNSVVSEITFGELLSFTSGLRDQGTVSGDYQSLKQYLTQPSLALSEKVPQVYCNLGYALCRLLLPKLNGDPEPTGTDQEIDTAYAQSYLRIINELVFAPVGVPTVFTYIESSATEALAYAFPGKIHGYDWATGPSPAVFYTAGAGGLFTSIDDFIPVLESLSKNNGQILTSAQWNQMQSWTHTFSTTTGDQTHTYPLCFGAPPTAGPGYLWIEKNGGVFWPSPGTSVQTTSQASVGLFGSTTVSPTVGNAPVYAVLLINSEISSADKITSWMFCEKCCALFYAGNDVGPGQCPGGGMHSGLTNGWVYDLDTKSEDSRWQSWRWCLKCHALCFTGNSAGICSGNNGGPHEPADFNQYYLAQQGDTAPSTPNQDGWRYCKKCQVLTYLAAGGGGVCAASGPHDVSSSGDYVLSVHVDGVDVTFTHKQAMLDSLAP